MDEKMGDTGKADTPQTAVGQRPPPPGEKASVKQTPRWTKEERSRFSSFMHGEKAVPEYLRLVCEKMIDEGFPPRTVKALSAKFRSMRTKKLSARQQALPPPVVLTPKAERVLKGMLPLLPSTITREKLIGQAASSVLEKMVDGLVKNLG